jgi:hypothetical protein
MQVFARVSFLGVFLASQKHAKTSQNRLNEPLERCAGLSSSLLITETRAKLLTIYQSYRLSLVSFIPHYEHHLEHLISYYAQTALKRNFKEPRNK